ncbi:MULTISPECIES: hypothetical protein [unclassified Polaromonas]|jgi:hypothetical protein|uniref:hypothetical protein n=1 Tax=unclassified Polaromonas TaxID=2638319 RepID=UPI000F07953E|nr:MULTISPECIES: hypothetical protein [unclassified Polaromonas]AYQ28424.1 hypothetical protein DT070_10575 [Polaromonas sp. SP1]QGJ20455.1 hypothetical protein F7R28_20030 [Polaromonas sp. Pch-P]
MNTKFFKGPVLALLAAAVLLGGNALAQSQPLQDESKPAKSKSKSKKATAKPGAASPGGRAKFIRGSEESPAQRTARLKRECKGGVDAGACAGYTR